MSTRSGVLQSSREATVRAREPLASIDYGHDEETLIQCGRQDALLLALSGLVQLIFPNVGLERKPVFSFLLLGLVCTPISDFEVSYVIE